MAAQPPWCSMKNDLAGKCIKCKAAARMTIADTVQSLPVVFERIDLLLRKSLPLLSREAIQKIQNARRYLIYASKARYCTHCAQNAASFAEEALVFAGEGKAVVKCGNF